MHIRFIYPADYYGKAYTRGAVIDVPEGDAVSLIAAGMAVKHTTTQPTPSHAKPKEQ